MTIDTAVVIQSVISAVISSGMVAYVTITIKHRKKEEKSIKLVHIKLESIYSGLINVNSQFAAIGRDFKSGYEKRKRELLEENNFIEE